MMDGLRESADYRIFERKFVFKLLMSFHDSPTSDHAAQVFSGFFPDEHLCILSFSWRDFKY
jgi:hypothetical protein